MNTGIFCRKVLSTETAIKHESSLDYLTNRSSSGVFDVAHLVLMLLPSRDGVVLRKLLMTAVSDFKLNLFSLNTNYCSCYFFFTASSILDDEISCALNGFPLCRSWFLIVNDMSLAVEAL